MNKLPFLLHFDFLFFTLSAWILALFTVFSDGWFFIAEQHSGLIVGNKIALILALDGLFLSLAKIVAHRSRQKPFLSVHIGTWCSTALLVSILTLNMRG